MCDNEELVDLKAWACSVQGRAQTKNHPFLVKCLGRALCLANASTSRCERDFANLNMAFGKRAASPHLKELHVRVTDFIKSNPGLRDQVVERAGQIWKEQVAGTALETLSVESSCTEKGLLLESISEMSRSADLKLESANLVLRGSRSTSE